MGGQSHRMCVIFSISFLATALGSVSATAEPLSQGAIYVRCHSQFVRRRPASEDPLLAQVRAGKLKAVDACMALLDETNLNSQGEPAKAGAVDSRPYQVLRTFQAFHMTWFPLKDFIRQETENPTTNLYDANEMGYHLTYNLFGIGAKYSEVVTRPGSFRGVRVSRRPATHLIDPDSGGGYSLLKSKKWALTTKAPETFWRPKLVGFGELIGIAPMSSVENRIKAHDDFKGDLDFDASVSQGAGILGSKAYILLSSNQNQGQTSDGGLVTHRAWSRAIFSDLMCRSLPVLRQEDATAFVEPQSQLPFRRNAQCMQCHSTMDPLASTIRNVMDFRLGGARDEGVFCPRVLATFKTDQPALPTAPPSLQQPRAPAAAVKSADASDADWQVPTQDPLFHRRPPRGKLYYRDYQGRLVSRELASVQDLGKTLAESDDLYLCAAKRYFEFMTGVNVELGDFSVPPLSQVDTRSARYRDFVVKAGLHLKSSQSLKKLIQDILQSEFYAQSDYGAGQ